MKVWNRKELIEVPEVGLGAIRFTYDTAFGRILAKAILCRKIVSRLYGAWQKSRFSRGKVEKFIKEYGIDTSDCTRQEFSNFNDFFTRQRRSYVDQTGEGELPAIADSKLLALPIGEDSCFEIKGVPYTVEELLEDPVLAQRFTGGYCLIFRLAPDDYHRYVYPDLSLVGSPVFIRGVLHTVNPIAAKMKVYRRNARCYQLLRTDHFGEVLQMEVGALLVGKIRNYPHAGHTVGKLQEKGYFEYGGSTVILLVQKDAVRIDDDILEYSARGIETKVHIGEKIGISCRRVPQFMQTKE